MVSTLFRVADQAAQAAQAADCQNVVCCARSVIRRGIGSKLLEFCGCKQFTS